MHDAELADTGNTARASRAAAAAAQLANVMAGLADHSASARDLLNGPNGQLSLPILHSLAARSTTRVLQAAGLEDDNDDGPLVPKPYGDDWEECAEPWAASALEYHTPCLARDIPEAPLTVAAADAARTRGEQPPLTQLCPRGFYIAHLLLCDRCCEAERTGVVFAACKIHTVVALARGAWVLPDPYGPEKPQPQVAQRPAAGTRALSPGDKAFIEQQMAVDTALAITRALSPAEEADPNECGPIALVHVVWRERMALPPDIAAVATGTLSELDVQRLARHAHQAARADAEAYLIDGCAAPGSTAKSREMDFRALLLARSDAAKRKGRVVVALNKTVNLGALRLSIDYSTAAHLMTGRGKRAVVWVHDGEKAFNQLLLHRSAQRQFVFWDPVANVVRQYLRCPFGGNQTCTLFSIFTALIKAVLRECLSSLGGGGLARAAPVFMASGGRAKQLAEAATTCALSNRAHADAGRPVGPVAVGGILDDIAVVINPHGDQDVKHADAVVRAVFTLVNFRTNGKEQFGADGVIEVLGTRADLRQGTLTPRGVKLYETLYQLSLLQTLSERAQAPGAPTVSVPVSWLESVAGSFEWSGPTFDWRLRLHRQGIYAAVAFARQRGYHEARLGDGTKPAPSVLANMLRGDVDFVLRHAHEGRWRPMQFFDARDLDVVKVFCARCPSTPLPSGEAAVQARAERAIMPRLGAEVVGIASDASIDDGAWGSSVWAVHVPAFGGDGAGAAGAPGNAGDEIMFRATSRADDDSSGTVELAPWLAVLERHGAALRGKFLVMMGDNLGNMYRVNRGRIRRGTRAHAMLMNLYDLAAEHEINFLALWLPRAANQYLDAISKCRTLAEAQGAVGPGVRVLQA